MRNLVIAAAAIAVLLIWRHKKAAAAAASTTVAPGAAIAPPAVVGATSPTTGVPSTPTATPPFMYVPPPQTISTMAINPPGPAPLAATVGIAPPSQPITNNTSNGSPVPDVSGANQVLAYYANGGSAGDTSPAQLALYEQTLAFVAANPLFGTGYQGSPAQVAQQQACGAKASSIPIGPLGPEYCPGGAKYGGGPQLMGADGWVH